MTASAPQATAGIPIVPIGSLSDVQRALNAMAAGAVPDDEIGAMGPRTKASLVAFQRAYMLPPTGEPDQQTRATLAKVLGLMGVATFVPSATTSGVGLSGAPPASPATAVDRAGQIRQHALTALGELQHIGLPAVADALRSLLANPTIDGMSAAIATLGAPGAGSFANQVASLWKPALDAYRSQPDPAAALRSAIAAQMAPLLSQIDVVLGGIQGLAAAPTVDHLSATIAALLGPQGGALGAKVAKPLQALLTEITAHAA